MILLIIIFISLSIPILAEDNVIIPFSAIGTFQADTSKAKQTENCLGGFNNHLQIAFNTGYKVFGKYSNLRISTFQDSTPIGKMQQSSEIQFDDKSKICTSKLEVEVPKSEIYKLAQNTKKKGFINPNTAIYHYSKELDQEDIQLSFLSCFMPKEIIQNLLLDVVGNESILESNVITLKFNPGTIYSKCELKMNKCDCGIVFHKIGLKKEIESKFQ